MNAPTPLVSSTTGQVEDGGQGLLIDRYSDYEPNPSEVAILQMRFQDDRSGKWSKTKEISLGKLGESDIIREIAPMGTYRTRQIEFVFTGIVRFGLFSIQDNIKALEG